MTAPLTAPTAAHQPPTPPADRAADQAAEGPADRDFDQLLHEHHVLMRAHGRVQARCSQQLQAQTRMIDHLQAQALRLRAAVIVRETALAWAREDRAVLEQAIPGLPRRVALARHVDTLVLRIRSLLRERLQPPAAAPAAMPMPPEAPAAHHPGLALEASLGAADLVICQTGCISHGDYWRVQDHCRRTGKACVLVERPGRLRIVRINRIDPIDDASPFDPVAETDDQNQPS